MDDTPTVVTVRLGDLAARLDAEIERLRRAQPGVGWDRSKVIRMALESYLRSRGEAAA